MTSISIQTLKSAVATAVIGGTLAITSAPVFAQAATDPGAVIEGTRARANGQASGIDARATPASQMGANASGGFGPFSLNGRYSESSSAGLTRVRNGAIYVDRATVRGSDLESNGTANNIKAENATVDIGVIAIGPGAAS